MGDTVRRSLRRLSVGVKVFIGCYFIAIIGVGYALWEAL